MDEEYPNHLYNYNNYNYNITKQNKYSDMLEKQYIYNEMNKKYKNIGYDGNAVKFDAAKIIELVYDYLKSNHNGESALDKEHATAVAQTQVAQKPCELIPEEEQEFIPEVQLL